LATSLPPPRFSGEIQSFSPVLPAHLAGIHVRRAAKAHVANLPSEGEPRRTTLRLDFEKIE
jgi:hypothetical protein